MEKMERMQIRLPKQLKTELTKEAVKYGISVAELIRKKINKKDVKSLFAIAEVLKDLYKQFNYLNNNINQIAKYVNYYKNADNIALEELQKQLEDLNNLKTEIKNILQELKRC